MEIGDWCRRYLPNHFNKPSPAFRIPLLKHVNDNINTGIKMAIAEPRGHGKTTTWVVGLSLWALCVIKKRYVVIIGSNAQNAESNLASIIEELENNEQIRHDYPHLRARLDASGKTTKYTDRDVEFMGDQKISARGTGTKIRGMKFRNFRPDLLILDDIEDEENVNTEAQRQKTERWFTDVVLNLEGGSQKADIITIGTIIHNEALIAKLVKENRYAYFERSFQDAILDMDAQQVLWPDEWSWDRLMQKREEIGDRAFSREFRNRPLEEGADIFHPERTFYFDNWLDDQGQFMNSVLPRYCFIDPAEGKRAGCHTSVVIGCVDSDNILYVIDWQTLHIRPTVLMEMLEDLNNVHNFRQVFYEANGMQGQAIDFFKEYGGPVGSIIEPFYQTVSKERRIIDYLDGPISTKKVLFHPNWEKLHGYKTSMQQLWNYEPSKRKEVDAPDALASLRNLIQAENGTYAVRYRQGRSRRRTFGNRPH